ncbi:MAG: WavE lipopolysaccharide synthesis family protein, partial [Deferribacteraceae bacterium]|jgi:hypothetical protein|nr:WavE lipopolysaccharide synthesis family protein [Deferribacteraceae bacterium]
MLVAIQAGLEAVKTKYTLKIRSDLIIKSSDFLQHWDAYPKHNGKMRIFEHRIVIGSTFAQFAHVMDDGMQLLPFHMSDWVHFGLTDDLKMLFGCPLQSENAANTYWHGLERKNYEPFPAACWQYPPESYILYAIVKKKFPQVKFENTDDYNATNMQLSNMVMADNFIILDDSNFHFVLKKYPQLTRWSYKYYDGFITQLQWQYLYKTYCDPEYKFFDFDWKRVLANIFNIKLLLQFPKRYIRAVFPLGKKLREKFYIGLA